MKRHISFGEIKQFRNVVRSIKRKAQFEGIDENGEAIINELAILPTLRVTGTEKIHGTNASVCLSRDTHFYVQGRNGIITPEQDNAGCAFAAENNRAVWIDIMLELAAVNDINVSTHIITVFYEWCGQGIQKKTAVAGLSKRAIIFREFKVSPIHKDDGDAYWLETGNIDSPEHNIFNINNYKTYTFGIDFNNPNLAVNKIIAELPSLEENSPVGEAMGIKGNVGEGIVITFWYKGSLYRFKVKGEKHANSKVKTLKPVDEEKEMAKIDFANYACTADRLEQAWVNTFGLENQEPAIEKMGTFLRAVFKDVIKEESDVMSEKKLEPKDVGSRISKIARVWFMEQLNNVY